MLFTDYRMTIQSHTKDKAPVHLSFGNQVNNTSEPTFTMKLIPLTQGKFAMVDDGDYDFLMQWKWHARKIRNSWYAARAEYGDGKHLNISLHRFILSANGRWNFIDHIDGNGLNCQRNNMRICSNAQNQMNKPSRFGNSKYKGVHWCKTNKKWIASARFNGCKKHIGGFNTEVEAAIAYDSFAKVNHGEFAYLNLPIASQLIKLIVTTEPLNIS